MILTNFSVPGNTDAILQITLAPPANITGWSIGFEVTTNFGGVSGIIQKWVASGFNAMSGISYVNPNQGVFNVQINATDTSGLDFKNYAFSTQRLDSGAMQVLSQGYLSVLPT